MDKYIDKIIYIRFQAGTGFQLLFRVINFVLLLIALVRLTGGEWELAIYAPWGSQCLGGYDLRSQGLDPYFYGTGLD